MQARGTRTRTAGTRTQTGTVMLAHPAGLAVRQGLVVVVVGITGQGAVNPWAKHLRVEVDMLATGSICWRIWQLQRQVMLQASSGARLAGSSRHLLTQTACLHCLLSRRQQKLATQRTPMLVLMHWLACSALLLLLVPAIRQEGQQEVHQRRDKWCSQRSRSRSGWRSQVRWQQH